MKIILVPIFYLCLSSLYNINSLNEEKVKTISRDKVIQTAIKDFSKTKLFRKDTIFYVTFFDTVHRIGNHRIGRRNAYIVEKDFTELVVVDIRASQFRYLLDTTATIDNQNKGIPSRVIEKDGKLFLWRDKHYPVTDSTLKVLDKFHLLVRGTSSDIEKFLTFDSDDSQLSAAYYFCRNNLSICKKVISSKAVGFYDPPKLRCKP